MHFFTPSFGTFILAAALGIAVMLAQRAKWVRTLRADMVKADLTQTPVPHPTSTANEPTLDE
jgi:hypothetical protein